MPTHGFCPSKKRMRGKHRKNNVLIITEKCLGSGWKEEETTYEARKYRTRNQSTLFGMAAPSRKRVKGNRRRARRKGRLSVVSAANEFEEEKKMKKREVEKMKKEHATKTRQMQKRFLRDIHELWEKQAKELTALKESI